VTVEVEGAGTFAEKGCCGEKATNILVVDVTAESFSIQDFVEFCQRRGRNQDFPFS